MLENMIYVEFFYLGSHYSFHTHYSPLQVMNEYTDVTTWTTEYNTYQRKFVGTNMRGLLIYIYIPLNV
jgi:hypothetical protein